MTTLEKQIKKQEILPCPFLCAKEVKNNKVSSSAFPGVSMNIDTWNRRVHSPAHFFVDYYERFRNTIRFIIPDVMLDFPIESMDRAINLLSGTFFAFSKDDIICPFTGSPMSYKEKLSDPKVLDDFIQVSKTLMGDEIVEILEDEFFTYGFNTSFSDIKIGKEILKNTLTPELHNKSFTNFYLGGVLDLFETLLKYSNLEIEKTGDCIYVRKNNNTYLSFFCTNNYTFVDSKNKAHRFHSIYDVKNKFLFYMFKKALELFPDDGTYISYEDQMNILSAHKINF